MNAKEGECEGKDNNKKKHWNMKPQIYFQTFIKKMIQLSINI